MVGSRANANSGFVVELGFVEGFVVEGKEGVEGGVPRWDIAVVVVFGVVNVAEDGWIDEMVELGLGCVRAWIENVWNDVCAFAFAFVRLHAPCV